MPTKKWKYFLFCVIHVEVSGSVALWPDLELSPKVPIPPPPPQMNKLRRSLSQLNIVRLKKKKEMPVIGNNPLK